jgi:Rrf2 family transcriptional regulator, cysteine metabolism repressor
MKLSLTSEYALLVLIQIARHEQQITTTIDIMDAQQISEELLGQILAVLIKNKFVKETGGNYQLAKQAIKVSVGEIIRLFDGALAPVEPVSVKGYILAPMEREEKLSGLFYKLQEQIVGKLSNTTLADLV